MPKSVAIHEVGPREGMQLEAGPIPTDDKVRLVDLLSGCRFPSIQVTSFVSPKWVPQMADAEEVASRFVRHSGIRYTCTFLNLKGLRRAQASAKFDLAGIVSLPASDTFWRKNANRGIQEVFAEMPRRLSAFRDAHLPSTTILVSAAFGCNYEGPISEERVIELLDRALTVARESHCSINGVSLGDTMGWATPQSIRSLVWKVHNRWPSIEITLHLHDTRGLGLANAFAAMEMGVSDFDAAVGGLGGCPFAANQGAAGNIPSEDLVHMCEEMGVETGIDLERLLEVAREAEKIVGHPLPGKVMHGGSLASQRRLRAGGD